VTIYTLPRATCVPNTKTPPSPRRYCAYILENGLGIFARVRISRETRLVSEAPLLKAAGFSACSINVQEPFDRLSSAKQRAYFELHGYVSEAFKRDNDWESLPELNRRVLAIYAANSFGKDVFWLTHGSSDLIHESMR
jgi:hypothetical protein